MTLGSLFDGIAGFPLAAAGVGIKTVWTSEIEPNCMGISARHFPEAKQLGDITKLNGEDIDPVDIISFGSPCQNLSIAGNQRGLDGKKSKLFFEAVRIVYEMRGATNGGYPKYIIWENVAGAFSSNKGQDFRRVLEEITKTDIPMPNSRRWAAAGMVRGSWGSAAWRVLDAQYWGVPQRRKRIYLVHSFGNERAGQILFECESMLRGVAQGRAEGQGNSPGIGRGTEEADSGSAGGMAFGSGGKAERANGKKSATLKETDSGSGAAGADGLYNVTVYTIAGNIIGRNGRNGGNQMGIGKDVSYTLTAADRHCVAVAGQAAGFLYRAGAKANGIGYEENKTPTIMAGQLPAVVKEERVRRLTPTECERLDGFPDGWTRQDIKGNMVSDTARYTALGNSIAVPCAERVFRGIIAAEQGEREGG